MNAWIKQALLSSAMRHCYAERLGNCGDGLTLEHFVSRSLLEDLEPTFAAEGLLPTDPATTIQASASSVASRVLCATHNSRLSEVDRLVVPFLSAGRRFDHELNSTSRSVDEAVVDGHMLERWLAKALLGLIARPRSSSTLPVATHDLLVEVAFGLTELSPPLGLHLDISPDRPMASLHDFSLVALCDPDQECRAVTFSSASIRWLLALGKSGLPDETYRPDSVILRAPTSTRILRLQWSTGVGSGNTLTLDRRTFDTATVPELFTPVGTVQLER